MSTDSVTRGTDVDHCPGTLIVHLDGVVDCTDQDCPDPDRVRHSLVADCAAVAGLCRCDPLPGSRSLRAAS